MTWANVSWRLSPSPGHSSSHRAGRVPCVSRRNRARRARGQCDPVHVSRPDVDALLEELRVDEVLKIVTPQEVAETWMRYQSDPVESDFWAVSLWMEPTWWADEDRVRDGILRLVDLAVSEQDYCIIGASVLEDFATDDESRLHWIERQAAASDDFRQALECMWCGDCPTRRSAGWSAPLASSSPTLTPRRELVGSGSANQGGLSLGMLARLRTAPEAPPAGRASPRRRSRRLDGVQNLARGAPPPSRPRARERPSLGS